MSIEIIVSLITALGVGGILGAILNRGFEQQKQINEHDIKIFNQSNEILDEEKLSFVVSHRLWGNHSISDESYSFLINWCSFFQLTGNCYLDKKISKENKKMLDELLQLTQFINHNFFTIVGQNPNNNNQYLKPDWNIDRGVDPSPEKMAKYKEYAKELEGLIQKVLDQYSVYRLVIKQKLKI
jgi:hypothetical protein